MSAGAANVLWSVALLTGLALLAFAMALAEKPAPWMARSSANVYNDSPNLTAHAADDAYNATGHPTI